MKILLAYKPADEENDIEKVTTPGGLLTIGALLKEQFIDTTLCNFSYSTWQEIEDKIKNIKPAIIGTTCYAFNRHEVLRLAKLTKLIDKNIKVIVGGPFATALPERMLKYCSDIDVIVLGEGEKTILQLIKAFQNKTSLKEIDGIAFRENDEIITTKQQQLIDLNWLPIPAKHFKYNHIMTSRGCPGQCIFCATPKYWGSMIRFRNIQSVVKEFALLKKRGIGDLIISDDTFTADKQRVMDFSSSLIKERINVMWDCRSRYNFVDKERLTAMKKAGCYKIGYGVESGSKKILSALKKFISPEEMIKAAKETRSAGLYQYVFLIVGSPGEDESTIQETTNLIEEIKPQAILTSFLHTYPGTELYETEKHNGRVGDLNWFRDEEHLPERYICRFKEREEMLKLFVDKVYDIFRKYREEWKLKEDELKRSIELCSFDVFSMNELAKIHAKREDYATASEMFQKASMVNPFFASTFLNLGILFEKTDKLDEAIKHYKKAIALNPQNAVAFKNLGNAYCKIDDIPKAITAYENAVLFGYEQKAQLNAIIEHLKGQL